MRRVKAVGGICSAAVVLIAGLSRGAPEPPVEPRAVTVPFATDHDRMLVEVQFARPDGSWRAARAWVDTGNQVLVLGGALARDLGLVAWETVGRGDAGAADVAVAAPRVRLAGMRLPEDGVRAKARPVRFPFAGVPAEANLPASLLRHWRVVLDYPASLLTVALTGAGEQRGVPVPCRVNAETGLLMVTATVDGEDVQLGVDNGSSSTWVSSALAASWQARHPEWPHATGAVGTTNFFGFPFEAEGELIRVPEVRIGSAPVWGVAVLALDRRLFEWYSEKSAGPVVGFIGANMLKRFRVEIDFRNRMTYWEAGLPRVTDDLDIVGLTLRPGSNGSFTIAGVARKNGASVVEGVSAGDHLLRIDAFEASNASMGAVVDALRGKPGELRTLVLERDGKRRVVAAPVGRFP
jgi:hypothetical protein